MPKDMPTIHYRVRPGVRRPLCDARAVPVRDVTDYKAAVTCQACAALMSRL